MNHSNSSNTEREMDSEENDKRSITSSAVDERALERHPSKESDDSGVYNSESGRSSLTEHNPLQSPSRSISRLDKDSSCMEASSFMPDPIISSQVSNVCTEDQGIDCAERLGKY